MTFSGSSLIVAAVWILAIAVLIATVLPVWNTTAWWVRILDFPRVHVAVIAAVVVLLAAFLLPGPGRWIVPALMLACAGYQVWRIYPYTPLAAVEMEFATDDPSAIKVLASNVLMENERHDLLLKEIDAFDPDILLLMETDQAWIDAVEPALARYKTVLREPRDDYYGMVFATRLETRGARLVRLTSADTPAAFAELSGPDGTPFRFVGLHPRPPTPGVDTEERDAQIYYAARFASQSDLPLIATGDFNDVAWSDTSQLFKRVGRYLDPRIGRGFYASFDANSPILHFPIDQFYATPDVAVVSLERRAHIGSDHFPMAATIRLDAELAARLNVSPPVIPLEEQRAIDESVARSRERLGHETLLPQ